MSHSNELQALRLGQSTLDTWHDDGTAICTGC